MTRSFASIVVFLALVGAVPRAAASAASRVAAGMPGSVRVAVLADDDPKKDVAGAAASAKSGGMIDGQVTAIDYRSNTMSVASGSRKVDVTILPSTNIQGPNNGFRTIADIQRGSHVRVLLSQRAGLYPAQIITLR